MSECKPGTGVGALMKNPTGAAPAPAPIPVERAPYVPRPRLGPPHPQTRQGAASARPRARHGAAAGAGGGGGKLLGVGLVPCGALAGVAVLGAGAYLWAFGWPTWLGWGDAVAGGGAPWTPEQGSSHGNEHGGGGTTAIPAPAALSMFAMWLAVLFFAIRKGR